MIINIDWRYNVCKETIYELPEIFFLQNSIHSHFLFTWYFLIAYLYGKKMWIRNMMVVYSSGYNLWQYIVIFRCLCCLIVKIYNSMCLEFAWTYFKPWNISRFWLTIKHLAQWNSASKDSRNRSQMSEYHKWYNAPFNNFISVNNLFLLFKGEWILNCLQNGFEWYFCSTDIILHCTRPGCNE